MGHPHASALMKTTNLSCRRPRLNCDRHEEKERKGPVNHTRSNHLIKFKLHGSHVQDLHHENQTQQLRV